MLTKIFLRALFVIGKNQERNKCPNKRVMFIKDYASKGTGVTHTPRNHGLEKIFLLVLGRSAPSTQDQTPSLHLFRSRCCLPAVARAFPAVWMPFLHL